MERRQANGNLIFARIREELDFIVNIKKEGCIVVTGMSLTVPKLASQIETRQWINKIAKLGLVMIVLEAREMVQFVSANRSYGSEVLVYEVNIKDREDALRIRKELAN